MRGLFLCFSCIARFSVVGPIGLELSWFRLDRGSKIASQTRFQCSWFWLDTFVAVDEGLGGLVLI